MAQIGISITKKTSFRDATQEFSNTYHYSAPALEPQPSLASDLIDYIVNIEKNLHSGLVTFVHARCWSSGGTIEDNQMIFEKALSGVGNQTTITSMDKERAVLVQWPAGLDSRGRPVYLRKWYHSCGNCAGGTFGTNVLDNTTKIAQSVRDLISAEAAKLSRIPATNLYGLVAESGRTRSGGLLSADPPACHPYLEHHQLGDQWRG